MLWTLSLLHETKEGGIIALIEEGDVIVIDIPQRSLVLDVGSEVLDARRSQWHAPAPRVTTGLLGRYANHVRPASEGSILGQ